MASPGIEVDSDSFSGSNLSEAEKELTENEIGTLKQLLANRQKQAAQLKQKLGISPLNEIAEEVSQGIKTVRDTAAYQKTSQVVSGTTDAVRGVLTPAINDIRSSSLFKTFEEKMGTAFNSAKMAASTSIDHLAGFAGNSNKPPGNGGGESVAKNGPNGGPGFS